MNRSIPDKAMPVTTLVNLRLFLGQLEELEAFARENHMTLDQAVSMLVSNSIEDLALEPGVAILQSEEIEPPIAS